MIRLLRYFFTLLLLTVAGAGWAEDVTFSPSEFTATTSADYSLEKSGVTMAVTKSTVTADQFRIFKNQSLTISCSSAKITKIVITCTVAGAEKYGPGCFAETDGYSYDEKVGTWQGESNEVVLTASANQVRATEIVVTIGETTGKQTPTVKIGSNSIAIGETTEVTTNGPALTLTTADAAVASVTGTTVKGVAAGETTITATWAENATYQGGTKQFAITVTDPNAAGSKEKPYSVAQALDVIADLADGAKTSDKVYVKGVISSITEISTAYGNATYIIKDDNADNALTIFRGKYLNNASFTSQDQLHVGDIVVVYGQLQKYVKDGVTTPEMAQDNFLESIESSVTEKQEAGIAWSSATATATLGATNTFPTLTNPHSLAVTYSSSNTGVATIAADGAITLVAAGKTVIKAVSAEDDTYKAGEATYTLTVKEQSGEQGAYLFHETFDQVGGTGGNDGTFSGASSKLNNNGQNPTDETWDVLTSVYGGSKCMRFGAASADGVATTRSIALTGNGTLTFKAAGWNGSTVNTLNVTATGATLSGDTEITLVNEEWNEYTVTITGGTGDVVLTFSGRRGFLDEIGVTGEGGETPSKQQAGLAWSAATATATIGADDNVFPTLTNPHALAVTYTSSNEEAATIAADGAITLVGEGKTTIKAASAETETYYAGSATYELTVTTGKAEAGLAWSESNAVVYIGADDNVFPTLENPNNLTVTYSSSRTDFATIDETTGAITLVGVGKTTITAESAENDGFKAGKVSYTLTVKEKAEEGNDVFVLVEDASTLAADDEIVIVGSRTADDETSYYGMSITQNSNNRAAEDVNMLSDGTIKPNSNVQRFTLEGDATGWYFGCADGYIYAASSSGNYLRTKTTADDNAMATIDIADGIATVIFQGANTRNNLRFNYNSGTPLFACYASTNTSMPKVQIFRRQTPATSVEVTIGEAGYATLYYGGKNLQIPSGVKAYTCKTNDGKKTIESQSYSSVIPAGSAVVLQAAPGTYEFAIVNNGGTPAADNMLCGTDKKAALVAPGEGEYRYYKLADGEVGLGFYRVDDSFVNGAHKAYLAVPASSAADYYSFDLVDGIDAVTVNPSLEGAAIYTLSGVRMNTTQLPAGIYIVNGKKMVVK